MNFQRILTLFFMNLSLFLNAQIYSPSADNSRPTGSGYSRNDSIFIFFSTDALPKKGSLTAIPTEAGIYNFEWSKYNPLLSNFETIFPIQNNLTQSEVINLEEGGYKVRITNGLGVDVSYTAWVFINKLRVEVEKNDLGKIKTGKYTCDFLVLNGKAIVDTFQYYDLSTHQPLILSNGYNFLWTSDNPDLIIPNANKILDPNITYRPPYIDTRYFLTVTDSFNMRVSDTVLYETINVKAYFTFQFFDKEDSNKFIEPSLPYEDFAPLKVKFKNKSLNGSHFEWIFSDSLRSGFFSNHVTSDLYFEPEFIYEIPDYYYPYLVSKSAQGCIDVFNIHQPILVLRSPLNISLETLIIDLYPNPVADNLTLNISGNYDQIIFELFDIQGHKLMSKVVNSSETISMAKFNNGIYLYKLLMDSKELSGKIIINSAQ